MEEGHLISNLLEAVNSLRAGSVVGVGGILMVVVRFYRMMGGPWPSEKWSWLVALVTFLVGLLGALFTGVFGFGLSWGSALLAALGVAVNAAGLHSVTKSVGNALPPQKAPVESPFRKAASLLLPPPRYTGIPMAPPKKE